MAPVAAALITAGSMGMGVCVTGLAGGYRTRRELILAVWYSCLAAIVAFVVAHT